MENEELVLTPQTNDVEEPQSVSTDMVELLTLVVDDLCVQVGELKEKIKDVKDKK